MKPPRPSQWEAIRATTGHVLVTAGAGTGKTYTVVARVLYELGSAIEGHEKERVSSPLRLRDLAAVTFTNEAAADLKRQLRERLREHGRADEAAEVDLARIGTIHAFCGEVLRESALRAGRGPLARVLEEGEAGALVRESAREALLEAVELDDDDARTLLEGSRTGDIVRWVVELLGHPTVLSAELDDEGPRERALLGLARRALRHLEQRLERDGAVDFDRMIVWTRDLLRDDPAVRRAWQRRTRLLIVDEFQDVDPLQKEIAYLLGGLDGPGAGDGSAPATRLMLVGDPKQSIYRFRHADVTVWRRVERDFAEHELGRVVVLEDNFRSVPAVLGFVDATVGRLLDTPVDGDALQDFEVPFRAVRALRTDGPDPAVEVAVVPPDDAGKARQVGEIRSLEAADIARRAVELNRDGIAWRDMAVLLVGWGSVQTYREALRSADVPAYVLRNEGLLDSRGVVDLLLALRVVRDPRDDTALLGFLRSPFVALRDDTLLALARAGGRPYWQTLRPAAGGTTRLDGDALGLGTDEAARLTRGVDLVREYADLRDRLSPAELLEDLLLQSGYLAHLALLGEDGDQARANIELFLTMVRQMRGAGTGEVVRVMQERRERGDRVAPAVLYAGRDDVVTITTIHSAKGLEWRVVFWADLVRGSAQGRESLLVGRDEIRLKDLETKAQPPAWTRLRTAEQLEKRAEDRRLWYVAATRARDRLVLSGIPLGASSRLKDTPAWFMRGVLPGIETVTPGATLPYEDDTGRRYEALVREVVPGTAAPEAETAAATSRDAAMLPRPPRAIRVRVGPARHSATEFLAYDRCPRRHWLRYIVGVPEPSAGRPEQEMINAVRRGQIVHDVLERIEAETELRRLLEDAIGRWDEDAPAPETPVGVAYRTHLSDEIQRVLHNPDYAAMVARPGARRELPFLHILDGEMAVEGRIDLAVPAGQGEQLELLDVKTTQCDADAVERKAAQYAAQRDAYVAAVDAIGSEPVSRFTFHFSHPDRAVAETLDDDGRASAAARVSRLADLSTRGPAADGTLPPLTSHAAECYFCGYRRVGLCPGRRAEEDSVPAPAGAAD